MKEQPENKEKIIVFLEKIFQVYREDLHNLGLGESEGDKDKKFDWENYGLNIKIKSVERGFFRTDYCISKLRNLIKNLEIVLKEGGEIAWNMPERENGKYLESCFAGLEYLEDEKDRFSTLVFRLSKNHPMEDGNKRISAVVFLFGLMENGMNIDDIKEKVDLQEFGLVVSQLENKDIEKFRNKIKEFLISLGFK